MSFGQLLPVQTILRRQRNDPRLLLGRQYDKLTILEPVPRTCLRIHRRWHSAVRTFTLTPCETQRQFYRFAPAPIQPPPNPHCVHREDSSSQLFYTINHTRNYLRTVALFAFHTVIFPRFVGIRDQGTVTIQEWHRQNASFQLERRSVCEKYRGRERGERRKRLTFHMYTFVKI